MLALGMPCRGILPGDSRAAVRMLFQVCSYCGGSFDSDWTLCESPSSGQDDSANIGIHCEESQSVTMTAKQTMLYANRNTPAATNRAAIQRRRSTFSWRNIPAANALATKVREAAAGPTKLTSFQERATKRL